MRKHDMGMTSCHNCIWLVNFVIGSRALEFVDADDDLCVPLVNELSRMPSGSAALTFEIGREGLVICNVKQGLNADFFEHELTFSEEFASETLEQIGLDLLASKSEACEFVGSQVC
jgi:hypothetical protein